MLYETTHVYTRIDPGGAPATHDRPTFLRCLHATALSNPPGQCPGPTPSHDSPASGVCHPKRAPCHPCLRHPWGGRVARAVAPPPTYPLSARCRQARAVAGLLAPEPPHLWQTAQHSWATESPLRLIEQVLPTGDAEPKALCCYGILRTDTRDILLRFVNGRLVSHVTTAFLAWVCARLARERKRVLVLIWDNASWPMSQEVRA